MRYRGVGRIFEVIRRVEAWLLAGSMLVIAGFTILNVFTRTLFGVSLAFAEELSRFFIILTTFVGLSYAAGRGRHIRMTALYDQLSPRARKALMVVIAGSTAVLLFALAGFSLTYVETVHALGTVSPALRLPLWLVYLAAPLGLTLGGVQFVLTVVRNLTTPGVHLSWDQKDEYEDVAVIN